MENLCLPFVLFTLFSCFPAKLTFKQPVDTNSRPIAFQENKQYSFPDSGVIFDNDFDGENLDSAVAIRYIEKQDNALYYWSGGGITAYSKIEEEYQELKDKIYVPTS